MPNEIEARTFEMEGQYNLLFGKFKADQRKVCELQQLGTQPFMCLPSAYLKSLNVMKSLRPSFFVFAYCK